MKRHRSLKASQPRKRRPKALNEQDTIKLLAFLERGELGPVRVGMLKNEVISLIGQPSDVSNPQAVKSPLEILWYGQWLELTFDNDILSYLSLRYKWQSHKRRCLKLIGVFKAFWATKISTWSYARSKTFLHSRRIGFYLTDWGDGSLTVSSKAGSIIFNDSSRMGLYSIGYAPPIRSPNLKNTTWQAPPRALRQTRSGR
jgi:hypothetical protein